MSLSSRRIWRAGAATIAAVAAGALLASCASAESGSDAGTADGETIKLFISYTGENPLSPHPNTGNATQAAVDAINANGGVKGRQLELIQCENLFEPEKSIGCARQGVGDDVVAWVGQDDMYTDQTLPILEQAGIPSVGLFPYGTPIEYTSSMSFPLSAGAGSAILGTPYMLQQLGHSSVTPMPCEYPSCKAHSETIEQYGPQFDLEVTDSVEILNIGMPDYSPLAQQIKDLNADAAALIVGGGPAIGLMKAAADIGFEPAYSANPQVFGENDAAENGAILEGFLNPASYPSPRSYEEYPMMEQFVKDQAAFEGKSVEEYLESVVFDRSWTNDVASWQAVYAAAAAIEEIPGEEVTRETLLEVLNDPSTSLNILDFMTWTPGVEGPEGYERMPQMNAYFTTFKSGKVANLEIEQGFDLVSMIEQG